MIDDVILVDADDNVIGTMPKMEAHVKGKLHRAFSVFIFNTKGELLLQQRARGKYHSGGKWTNTCCSHPRFGEDTLDAAHRRLDEEMAMTCDLKHEFSFVYSADMSEGISENEYDHVFFGVSDKLPNPDPMEVEGYKYISMKELKKDMESSPDAYTAWLKICFDRVMECYNRLF